MSIILLLLIEYVLTIPRMRSYCTRVCTVYLFILPYNLLHFFLEGNFNIGLVHHMFCILYGFMDMQIELNIEMLLRPCLFTVCTELMNYYYILDE